MMDHLFNDMEQNQKLEEIEADLERQREAVLKEAMTHGPEWPCSMRMAWAWSKINPWRWIACGRPSTGIRRI